MIEFVIKFIKLNLFYFDILYLTEAVDEFAVKALMEYDGKKFKSVNQGDADKLEEHEEEKIKEISEDKKSLLEKMKEILHDEVTDVVISRSGAMTITEVAVTGKPAIFIPFPFATENHQEYNARVLEKIGAAKILLNKDLEKKGSI